MSNNETKLICYYFPQYHAIPENDNYWGKGFTDWDIVKKSVPLFAEHYQPRIPLNNRYYNLADADVLKWQVDLASEAGIYGFCFYHYWFDGKLLLQKPLEDFLKNKELKLHYCLSWANPSWSKCWVGRDDIVIQKQRHVAAEAVWEKHFYYLKRFWDDPRYIKIDGKPIFLFYQPEIIKSLGKMLQFWNGLCKQNNMPGVYYVITESYPYTLDSETMPMIDAVVKFQPREAYNAPGFKNKSIFATRFFQSLRTLPEPVWNLLSIIFFKICRYEKVSYDQTWEYIVNNISEYTAANKPIFPGAFVDWDNTPRYGSRAKVFCGASPEKFANWMQQLLAKTKDYKNKFIFLNAWNEWSEGAYLEPDQKYNDAYLQVIKKLFKA